MSKDFDIGFRVFCCLGFKKEFWFLFFLSLSLVCVSSRGRAKRFVLEAESLRARRAKKAERKPRRIVRALLCVCVCVATTVVVVFAIVYLSLVVVEKKHITTKSNCVGLERRLNRPIRIW